MKYYLLQNILLYFKLLDFFFYQAYQTIYLLAFKKRKISSIIYEKMYETDVTLVT